MTDTVQVIGDREAVDVARLCAAFDLNGIRYHHIKSGKGHPGMTIAKVNGVNVDFFGWNEPAVKFIVENFELPTTINHEEN